MNVPVRVAGELTIRLDDLPQMALEQIKGALTQYHPRMIIPCPVEAGDVFGSWTVLEPRVPTKLKTRCRCSCGTEREVNVQSLLRRESKSCGHGLTFEDRFWSKTRGGAGGCVVWTAACNENGYGVYYVADYLPGPRMWLAHRVAWALAEGSLAEDINVLHSCDNPPCVERSHLFTGTQQDNIDDMIAKGRQATGQQPCGDRHGMAKLSADQVLLIRSLHRVQPQRVTAEQFGISKSQVERIQYGKSWSHL